MPSKPDPKRIETQPTMPPAGAADIWATLPPRSQTPDAAGGTPTAPFLRDSTEPFPNLPTTFGRYRVLKLLGSGGMGSVYLARDTQLDRLIALKVPRFAPEDGPQIRERFLREARAAATIHHPNLCPVHDAGEIDGKLYLTMAYIEGKTLTDLIANAQEALPERQVAALVRKLALALAEAHARKVIHRDLKPANVMLDKRGEPVVMDFGLARRGGRADGPSSAPLATNPLHAADSRLTRAGAIMGTPAYMSPEQADGSTDEVGPASDVYSLGVILYELLTGRLPFSATDLVSLLVQVVSEPPRSPFAFRPSLDPRLEAICMKSLQKKPERRYRTMAEFAAVLTEFLKATLAATAVEVVEVVESKPEVPRKRKRQRDSVPWAAWGGGAVTLLAVAVALVFALRPAKPPAEPTIPSPEPALAKQAAPPPPPEQGKAQEKPKEEPKKKVGPPAEGAELAWDSREDVRLGRRRLPDLSAAPTWYKSDFRGEKKDLPEGKAKAAKGRAKGYLPEGGYFLQPRGVLRNFAALPVEAKHKGPFGVDVVGRVTGADGRWGVSFGPESDPLMAQVTIGTDGTVTKGGLLTSNVVRPVEIEPGKHPKIDHGSGAWNRLTLIVAGRYVEVYVNDSAVCDPIALPRSIPSTPLVRLVCASVGERGEARAEFKSVHVVSAASLRPLFERGAKAK